MPWVIDYGATNHMVGTSNSFSCCQSLRKATRVTIADGSIDITSLGSVPLTSSLTLYYVLHVPRFYSILCLLVNVQNL